MRGFGPSVGCLLIALCVVSGGAVAADNPGVAGFEPDEAEVEAGETIETDLTIRVISANEDEAVESVAYTVVYDPEILSVVDVEQGPWLQGGTGTDVSFETAIDDGAGRLTVEQAREPPAGGVIGEGVTATVTFEVAADAPPSSPIVRYEEYDTQMLEYPLPMHRVTEMGSTIHIEGGGEERDPLAEAADDSPEIITPESSDGRTENTSTEGEGELSETDTEDQAGFGAVLTLVALLSAAALSVWDRQTT